MYHKRTCTDFKKHFENRCVVGLSHFVFQEANPLREWSGLRLGVNQEVNAIFYLIFPHLVCSLCPCAPRLSPLSPLSCVSRAQAAGKKKNCFVETLDPLRSAGS